jgi:hypothetical protein
VTFGLLRMQISSSKCLFGLSRISSSRCLGVRFTLGVIPGVMSITISVSVGIKVEVKIGIKIEVRVGIKIEVRVGIKVEVRIKVKVRIQVRVRVRDMSKDIWGRKRRKKKVGKEIDILKKEKKDQKRDKKNCKKK